MTGDLAVWFRAQLDADEQTARAAIGHSWTADVRGGPDGSGDWWTEAVIELTPEEEPWQLGDGEEAEATTRHIALHDPAFTLADITAKRAIIDRHSAVESNYADYPVCTECSHLDHEEEPFPCATLRLLAQPYAGRPGWHNEWTTT